MKKLLLAVMLVTSVTNAKFQKTIYDDYIRNRKTLYPNPTIHYLDEPTPNNFESFAVINKDYRDSVILMIDYLRNSKQKTILDKKEVWFIAGCIFTKLIFTK